jgi:hypothetical protein
LTERQRYLVYRAFEGHPPNRPAAGAPIHRLD